jgi:phosphate transport system substrate-binding protein
MHKKYSRLVSAIAVHAALVATPTPVAAQQKIMVDGSTGTAPLVAALGKAFAAKGGSTLEIGKGLGTRLRFDALADGRIDIAMASHGLKVDEVIRRGMTIHSIAKTAVVFAVHDSVKVTNLSEAQVCAIYEGKYRDWKDLGGLQLVIVAHMRPDSEVDTEVIRDGVSCLKAMKFPASTRIMDKSGDMARALAATPGALGVTSATVVEQSQGKLKMLALGGVQPTEANIIARRYRLTRDAFLITRKEVSPAVKAFIDFVRSTDGAAVIRANGAVAAR